MRLSWNSTHKPDADPQEISAVLEWLVREAGVWPQQTIDWLLHEGQEPSYLWLFEHLDKALGDPVGFELPDLKSADLADIRECVARLGEAAKQNANLDEWIVEDTVDGVDFALQVQSPAQGGRWSALTFLDQTEGSWVRLEPQGSLPCLDWTIVMSDGYLVTLNATDGGLDGDLEKRDLANPDRKKRSLGQAEVRSGASKTTFMLTDVDLEQEAFRLRSLRASVRSDLRRSKQLRLEAIGRASLRPRRYNLARPLIGVVKFLFSRRITKVVDEHLETLSTGPVWDELVRRSRAA